MDVLPLAATVATDAVRAQFAVRPPEHERRRPASSRTVRFRSGPARYRLALAALLLRAARAVAPAGHAPVH